MDAQFYENKRKIKEKIELYLFRFREDYSTMPQSVEAIYKVCFPDDKEGDFEEKEFSHFSP